MADFTPEFQEEFSGMSEMERDYLRDVARNDLYILSSGILGYKDVNVATHGAFCRFIQNQPKKRRLGLMPRGHLKSTTATIADSVRLGLSDPDECRILIAGETATNAEKFLSEIKGHFEKNALLRFLFPELIPARFSGPGITWSSSYATLNRSTVYKEATWSTVGVGGAIVGGHFTRIKCDDLIGFEAFQSDAVMQATIDWVENIDPLLVNQHEDIIDFIGTRWKRRDLYARVMKLYGNMIAVFTRGCIENGEPIFPAKYDMATYKRMMLETPAMFYAQYNNNPLAEGASDFPVGAARSFYFDIDGDIVLETPKGKKYWRRDQIDVVMACDPNSGEVTAEDPAAISVSAITPDDEILVLDSWSDRVSPSAFVDKIYEKYEHWHPRVVGIEQAGQQSTRHYFEKKAEEEQVYINVIPLKPKTRDKKYRIRTTVEPILRSGRLYVLETQFELRRMLDEFPDTDPIDELDALAYGSEEGMWKKPFTHDDNEKKQTRLKLLTAHRSKRTGY